MWDLQRVSHGPSFSEHLRTADMVLILETVAFLFDNMIQACGTAGEAADANIPHGISLCSGCPTNDLGKTAEDGQGLWCPPTCWETWLKLLAWACLSPCHCSPLDSGPVDGSFLFVTLPFKSLKIL